MAPVTAMAAAAATGARDTHLEPRYMFFFSLVSTNYFILTNDILQTVPLPNQTWKAHGSQCRPTTVAAQF